LNPGARRAAWAAVAGLVLLATACRPRPDVRVLADERLAAPLDQIAALYTERTGQRVHVALASRGRMDVMLVSGKDDLAFAAVDQVDARPATGGFDRASRRDFARGGGQGYAVIVRERAAARADVRAFLLFATDTEARAILASTGFNAP
jgi:ABC-type molybdate transport system substrate-binding protein